MPRETPSLPPTVAEAVHLELLYITARPVLQNTSQHGVSHLFSTVCLFDCSSHLACCTSIMIFAKSDGVSPQTSGGQFQDNDQRP